LNGIGFGSEVGFVYSLIAGGIAGKCRNPSCEKILNSLAIVG